MDDSFRVSGAYSLSSHARLPPWISRFKVQKYFSQEQSFLAFLQIEIVTNRHITL
jgi:hypothetical protein